MAANYTEVVPDKPERPSDKQIASLPAWAQKFIKKLEFTRDEALEVVRKFQDTQTKSHIYTQESPHLNLTGGPSFVPNFIQAKRIYFVLPRTEEQMQVFVNEEEGRVELTFPHGYPYLELAGQSRVNVVPKDCAWNLRPNTMSVLQSVQEADKLSHDDFVKKYGYSQKAIPEMMKKVLPERSKEKKIW